eukprot:Gb_29904 [translate_table: standard]
MLSRTNPYTSWTNCPLKKELDEEPVEINYVTIPADAIELDWETSNMQDVVIGYKETYIPPNEGHSGYKNSWRRLSSEHISERANKPEAVAKQMVAIGTNLQLVKEFGIDLENAFAFWDWVGGRYNVCRVADILPLSFQYGLSNINKILDCALSLDSHFHIASFEKNIVVFLSLLNVRNVSFLGYLARPILPYSQALEKFAPHIQQFNIERNGKGVPVDGIPLSYEASEIDFGELGTNGQHIY